MRSLLPYMLFGMLGVSACASGAGDEHGGGADPHTGEAMLQTEPAATCSLRGSGIAFPTSACEACMQEQCCAPTTVCFAQNGDCAALHSCIVGCVDKPDMIVLGPGGQGMYSCPASCDASHASAIRAHDAYDACIRTQCMPACE